MRLENFHEALKLGECMGGLKANVEDLLDVFALRSIAMNFRN